VGTGLPTAVQKLIQRHLASAADVETLLLLRRENRGWTASAVARELRIDGDQAGSILARLHQRGLLREARGSYHFDPRYPEQAEAVASLAQLYPRYRTAVVSLIYGPAGTFSRRQP
jgi:DNA-binding IclR family transcriptional regulator